MGFGGAVQAMVQSMKMNRNGRLSQQLKDSKEALHFDGDYEPLDLPRGSAEGISDFKKELAARRAREKRLAVLVVLGIVVAALLVVWIMAALR